MNGEMPGAIYWAAMAGVALARRNHWMERAREWGMMPESVTRRMSYARKNNAEYVRNIRRAREALIEEIQEGVDSL